ncbi:MAG: hypothetical protein H8D47_04375 [Planctomycetes bacterium]|nr:hypothetical protein [Planctomycetota bacterium]MBL7107336.1 hypothetical protein [Phycisphaerae bacterium]
MIAKNKSKKMLLTTSAAAVILVMLTAAIVYSQYSIEKIPKQTENITSKALEGAIDIDPASMAKEKSHQYAKNFSSNLENIDSAMESLDSISEAIDLGDTEFAKAQVEETKKMLKPVRNSMYNYVQNESKIENLYCPIDGEVVDPNQTPQENTCMYENKKIGFCSKQCRDRWNMLSDEEKQLKLDAAMKLEEQEYINNY